LNERENYDFFPVQPSAIDETLDLKRPINHPTNTCGLFGNPDFHGEVLDFPKIQKLQVFNGVNRIWL
jgi:hypothetical protein